MKTATISQNVRITLETRYGTLSRGNCSIDRYESVECYEIEDKPEKGIVSKIKKGHVIISKPGFYVVRSSDGFNRADIILIDVAAGAETSAETQTWKLTNAGE